MSKPSEFNVRRFARLVREELVEYISGAEAEQVLDRIGVHYELLIGEVPEDG